MKIAIRKFAILCFFMVSCGQTQAQSNWPIVVNRCNYNMETNEIEWHEHRILKKDYLPWGVCFLKPPFINKVDGLSTSETFGTEDDWTKDAMRIWNIEYKEYKIRRWGSDNVARIPRGPLFVQSCDRNNYNIVYILKANLPGHSAGEYKYIDTTWDWKIFYGVILMDTHLPSGLRRTWSRVLFTNIMIHELGHALGIPHLDPNISEFMASQNYPNCEESIDICHFQSADFEAFLQPYNPEFAYVPSSSSSGGGGGGGIMTLMR